MRWQQHSGEQAMPNFVLNPGDSKIFHDTEGGSDLVIVNTSSDQDGSYTYADDDGPARPRKLAPGGQDYHEVADGRRAAVENTGEVDLEVKFADDPG
jgi:hypothetical protein